MNEKRTEVIVEKVFPLETPLTEIVEFLPPKDCRFITYDMKILSDGYGSIMDKLVFI